MEDYKLIGAVGRPRNSAGWLVPILMNEAGLCFKLSDSPHEGVSRDEIDGFAQEEAVTLLQKGNSDLPVKLDIDDHKTELAEGQWKAQAYVFYQSSDAWALLSEENQAGWSIAFLQSGAEELSDASSGESRFRYRFVNAEALRSKVLPSLFETVRKACSNFLAEHFPTMDAGSADVKRLSDFGDLLTDLAHDNVSTEAAIRYSGLALLRSGNAPNFRAWLHTVSWSFDLSVQDPQHWRDKCLGLLDEAAAQKYESEVRKNLLASLDNPVLREMTERSVGEYNNFMAKAMHLFEEPAAANWGPEVQSIESEAEDVRTARSNE